MNAYDRCLKSHAEAAADGATFLDIWRGRGGYEGALARQRTTDALQPVWPKLLGPPMAATGHMPFPGHRHMGELG